MTTISKTINWNDGNGVITVTYSGDGNGVISIFSTPNFSGDSRSQAITIETTHPLSATPIKRTLLIHQEGNGSIDGGNALTNEFNNIIDCETADSTFGSGDYLYDCGGAE